MPYSFVNGETERNVGVKAGGDSDEQTMAAAREGDMDSLRLLFERHHRAMHRFFQHLTGSATLAEDLTQEVFFRLLKFRGTYRTGAAFVPWLYQIARNVHVDHLRKHRSEAAAAGGTTDFFEPPDPAASVELALVRSTELALLRQALLRLPPERRQLLVLSRWHNLPYADIAAIVQCEPGAVKTRVFRAVQQLADVYGKLGGVGKTGKGKGGKLAS
jgi:RNA polymerase sigma factor (sigma-70 family)